ncbi:MAG: anthranilate synthase component I [Rhodospirillaceae bacterium]|jgi:anthranilate synthase component I|nr:anthranilate synthase component I [Rhodospirillaceae bacterium]MBT7615029.1 anthranilate synthase component I [Rhodospirillaceae bacterium]MBT7646409.1 anthranilate synthase component I [Rhodospirillaceae bacterium]
MAQYEPDLSAFEGIHREGRPQVVWTKLVADLETPVSAMLKLAGSQPNTFLLESVEGGSIRGRYSIIGLRPDLVWRCVDNNAEINRQARYDSETFVAEESGAIDSLKALVRECHIDLPEELPLMAAALVGYVGYEMVRLMEHLPIERERVIDVPDGLLVRPTIMAIFDNVADEVTLVTPVWPEEGVNARAAYARACERLADVTADFERNLPYGDDVTFDDDLSQAVSNTPHERFLEIVQEAKDYINAGDAFQIVLSQRFDLPFTLPPFAYYRALRRVNPSPFLFYLNFGDFSVVGSSPEILVRVRDGRVTLRPLAGTRKRGADKAEDEALHAELLADPKECAEHLMLLDLGRNDVGRVAKIGSVEVTESFQVEYYSHVMHISSTVEGDLNGDYDAIDALVAGFPAGTVSGAPKVRAMEIIDELETERRGVYAGAIGYFSANGAMDTCIALRTAIIKDGVLHVQAGAGVVTDSDPESEHQECQNKARALLRAAEEAVRFAGRGGLNR